MKKGVCVIIQNSKDKILLMLRDNNPAIPFPNCWYLPSGGVEKGETPDGALIREMKEEMELELKNFFLFKIYEWPERTEFAYYVKLDMEPEKTPLHEGQAIKFFDRAEIKKMSLASYDNQIVEDFLNLKYD